MTVILELVFIDNLVIDYLLLKTTFEITGKSYEKGRLVIASVIGGIMALVYPLLPFDGLLLFLVKLLTGGLLLLLSNKFSFFKEIYYNLLIFFALTFISGGGIYFIATSFDFGKVTKYTSIFIILPVFLIINGVKNLIKILYRRKRVAQNLYSISFSVCGQKIEEKAFYDTGNNLYYKGLPVVVIDKDCFKKFSSKIDFLKTLKPIEVDSVNGKDKKNCFLCKNFKVITDEKEVLKTVYICIGKIKDLSGYKAILHPEVMEENYEEIIEKAN